MAVGLQQREAEYGSWSYYADSESGTGSLIFLLFDDNHKWGDYLYTGTGHEKGSMSLLSILWRYRLLLKKIPWLTATWRWYNWEFLANGSMFRFGELSLALKLIEFCADIPNITRTHL